MCETIDNLLKLSKYVSKYCVGMEGNISGKADKTMFIKASGSRLSELTEDDLVEFNLDGKQVSNHNKRGSMELTFHLKLLSFNEINFVSHTHPTNTLKILCSNMGDEFSKKRLFPDQVIFNGEKSCYVPYVKPGNDLTKVISEHVYQFINNENVFPKLILLQNHGIIACGKTIDECVMISEICEKSAEIFIGANILGYPNYLSDNSISELTMDINEKYRKSLLS